MNTEKLSSENENGNNANTVLSAAFIMYLNEDANGGIYVSKKPMNQNFYCTPARLKCVETKAKKVTKKGVFAGAICETIDGRILKVIKVKNRQGYERSYIREGSL
jgi:hypothetical protein